MGEPRLRLLTVIAGCVCALLGGCLSQPTEIMLTPEQVLPAGFQERVAPPEILDSVLPLTRPSRFWMRSFVGTGDWAKTTAHIATVAKQHGYRRVVPPSIPELQQVGLTEDDVYHIFDSKYGTLKIGVLNIKRLRETGGSIQTTADYVVFAGEDYDVYEPMVEPAGGAS